MAREITLIPHGAIIQLLTSDGSHLEFFVSEKTGGEFSSPFPRRGVWVLLGAAGAWLEDTCK